MRKIGLTLVLLALPASISMAAGPSLEKGKELFESTKLGTNGKSCATCHRDGKRLEGAASYEEGELTGIVNNCIARALAGKEMDPQSADMQSLVMYIRSLAGGAKK